VNDTLGHNAGDRVLKTMAKTLSTNLRVSDLAGRWGGDEFLVAVAGHDQAQLEATANKLKMLVERSEYGADGSVTAISVSVGAVMARPDDTIENLLDRGDALMYRDKEQGRTRTADGLAGVGAQFATAASDQQDFAWQVQVPS
jgi:diguanylate cyclase (GGDEF)-like protein